MFCLNCGNQLPEHARFCSKCGQPVEADTSPPETSSNNITPPLETVLFQRPPVVPPEPPAESPSEKPQKNKKKNRVKMAVILIIVLAILITVSILFFTFQNRTKLVNNFITAATDGNITEAISIYDESINDIGLTEAASDTLQKALTHAIAQFEAGETEYTDALRTAQSIEQISIARSVLQTDQFEEIYERLELLGASRVAYATGQTYQEDEKYPEAIAQFSAVSVDDTFYYEDAQARIAACQTTYKELILQEANAYISNEQYSDAMHLLDDALEVLPNDTALSALRDTSYNNASENAIITALSKAEAQANEGDYAGAIKTINSSLVLHNDDRLETALSSYQVRYTLFTAEAYIANNDYPGAIFTLSDGLEANPESEELILAYSNYCYSYVTMVIAEADTYIAELDYDSAISVVRQALETFPADEMLTKKLEDLTASKPVSLSSLDELNSAYWEWNSGTAEDPYGNDFSDCSNYVTFHNSTSNERYIEYRVYGEYDTLTGTIAPHADIGETLTCSVQIYADDVLVYNAPMVHQKTDAFDFSVDITGAEYIKIIVRTSDMTFGFTTYRLILADVKLWP